MLSFITLIFVSAAIKENHLEWYLRVMASSICLGFLFFFLHINRQKYLQVEHVEISESECKKIKGEMKLGNLFFTVVILTITTFYLGVVNIAAKKTMTFLHIRNEKVTVFVKQPWDAILERHLIHKTSSNEVNADGTRLGVVPGYKRYDDVTVSLNNLGTSVFLEFNVERKVYSLKIPSSEIIVDNVPIPANDLSKIN
ncbi:hypothetical protein D3C75_778370 [compost metagenome]